MDYTVLLHPYRFLIVAALSEKEASIKELQKKLITIPQAAMYRGVQKLEAANLIKRVSEKKVRGSIQVTYGLNFSMEKMQLNNDSAETYLNAAYAVFFAYVHTKLAEYMVTELHEDNKISLSRFNSTKIKIETDRMSEFVKATEELIQKYSSQEGEEFTLTTFLIPESNGGKE
jgi:hypothetical protein